MIIAQHSSKLINLGGIDFHLDEIKCNWQVPSSLMNELML